MDEGHHKQPEGASRQAIGMLAGGVVGFGIGAQSIFADFANAGAVPWATGLGYALAGCFAGLILTTLFVGETEPGNKEDETKDKKENESANDKK